MIWEQEMEIARQAALAAGGKLKALLGRDLEVSKKGAIDLVTEADVLAEKAILERIRARFPKDAILSEETGGHDSPSERVWIVDPMDGTVNFVHGLPFYAVCVGLRIEGRTVLGVVFNPETEECFEARSSEGAFLNGAPIRVSPTEKLIDALVATGFPYSVHEEAPPVVERLHRVLIRAQGIRRLGSAALDLCYVAAGRFDAYWEQGLKPWDTTAAALIVQEAGGRLTDYRGNPFSPFRPMVIASNGLVHEEMIEAMRINEERLP